MHFDDLPVENLEHGPVGVQEKEAPENRQNQANQERIDEAEQGAFD